MIPTDDPIYYDFVKEIMAESNYPSFQDELDHSFEIFDPLEQQFNTSVPIMVDSHEQNISKIHPSSSVATSISISKPIEKPENCVQIVQDNCVSTKLDYRNLGIAAFDSIPKTPLIPSEFPENWFLGLDSLGLPSFPDCSSFHKASPNCHARTDIGFSPYQNSFITEQNPVPDTSGLTHGTRNLNFGKSNIFFSSPINSKSTGGTTFEFSSIPTKYNSFDAYVTNKEMTYPQNIKNQPIELSIENSYFSMEDNQIFAITNTDFRQQSGFHLNGFEPIPTQDYGFHTPSLVGPNDDMNTHFFNYFANNEVGGDNFSTSSNYNFQRFIPMNKEITSQSLSQSTSPCPQIQTRTCTNPPFEQLPHIHAKRVNDQGKKVTNQRLFCPVRGCCSLIFNEEGMRIHYNNVHSRTQVLKLLDDHTLQMIRIKTD